jgi:hypothetical protein
MALQLVAAYSKKLGLPEYSSHSFSVSITSEVSDLSQVEAEVSRVYAVLQGSVDREIVNPGFVPGGPPPPPAPVPAQRGGYSNGQAATVPPPVNRVAAAGAWKCSPKQRELIEKVITEHRLNTGDVDGLAQQRFGVGLAQLNKLQASGLIEELLDTYASRPRGGRRA